MNSRLLGRFLLLAVVLLGAACSDHDDSRVRTDDVPAATEEKALPSSAGDVPPVMPAAGDPLADLARPAPPRAPAAALDAYCIETVETLMLENTQAIETNTITRELLRLLEEEGLLGRGRPEGLVRDVAVRMKEDIDAVRPPGLKDRALDSRQTQMLRLLGKSYADDLRRLLSPKGAGGQHEGKLRQTPSYPVERLQQGFEALTWKGIGSFVFDKVTKVLPEEIVALNGRKVALAGFLMPAAEYDDIHEFLLVDSLWTCCFGQAAAVNQVVIVKIPKDRPGIPFYQDPILVHGVLDVGVEEDEGWVTSIYRMTAISVESLPGR